MKLVERIQRQVHRQLFGFSVLDGFYLITLYAIGSYIVIDTPINVLVFGFYWWLMVTRWPKARTLAVTVITGALVIMTVTGVAIVILDRFTPVNFSMRVLHQIGARYFLLLTLPYFILHVSTPLNGRSDAFKKVAYGSWAALKISMWVGAFVALLTIQGSIIWIHVLFLAIAVPLIALHIWMSRQESGEANAKPFQIAPYLNNRLILTAVVPALLITGLVGSIQPDAGWEYLGQDDYMVARAPGEYWPSPATAQPNVHFRVELLAESNGCGVRACHPNVFNEWTESRHRHTLTDHYQAQFQSFVAAEGIVAGRVCAGCHDPVALYSGSVDFGQNFFPPESQREGISCMMCHSLFPGETTAANGAHLMQFPEYYYQGPLSLISMVGVHKQHSQDFLPDARRDDRLCIGCHRFESMSHLPAFDGWVSSPFHQQPKMIEACRKNTGCLTCHMAETLTPEKPGGDIRDHAFVMDPQVVKYIRSLDGQSISPEEVRRRLRRDGRY